MKRVTAPFRWIGAALLGLTLSGLAMRGGAPAVAAPASNEVDLVLVLAVDISSSMDAEEQRIQRDGYVAAFRSPDVINAITDGLLGRIAVTYVEWSDAEIQFVLVPWTLIDGKESAFAFADRLARAPVDRVRATSISGALFYAARLIENAQYKPLKKAIDVSGDGPNNNGLPVLTARDDVVRRGITINGLPILIHQNGQGFGNTAADIPNLDQYYRDCVIGGPDSFMFVVNTVEEFPTAIRRKLIQEIAAAPPFPPPSARPTQLAATADCLAGERRRGFGP